MPTTSKPYRWPPGACNRPYGILVPGGAAPGQERWRQPDLLAGGSASGMSCPREKGRTMRQSRSTGQHARRPDHHGAGGTRGRDEGRGCVQEKRGERTDTVKMEAHCGGMEMSDVRRSRTPEAETAKLKRLLPEMMPDNARSRISPLQISESGGAAAWSLEFKPRLARPMVRARAPC